jgi:hypothetical protein
MILQIQDTLTTTIAEFLRQFILMWEFYYASKHQYKVNHYDGFCGAASRCCSSSFLVGTYENILKVQTKLPKVK